MKFWIVVLIITSFLFWFLLSKIWVNKNPDFQFSNPEGSYVFPTPKVITTDPFSENRAPSLTIEESSTSSSDVIRP